MKYALLILCAFLLVGCNTPEEIPVVEKIFDPKVPGGTSLKNPKIQEVIKLEAQADFNQVTLTWSNPSIYIGQNFKIHIYRIEGDGTAFTLPDPNQGGNSAFLYYPRLDFTPFQDVLYVDQNTSELFNINSNQTYTYFVLIEKDGFFSVGKSVTVTTPELGDQLVIPPPTQFWKNYASRTGGRPDPDTGDIFMNTLDAGIPSITKNNGNMVYARSGTVLYISDTDNNRVLVYTNNLGKICYDEFTEGTIEFDICIALNGMAPLTPYAVLGQPDWSANLSCQDAGNTMNSAECLSAPTGLAVKDNILFISDSGNNRVKIYDTLPLFGCYNFENMLGDGTPNECSPTRVIGKQGINDLTTYNLVTDGNVSLSCPNGLEVYNNNLYIADTCNNRVVVERNAALPALFECNALNWKTSMCVHGGQFGQADMYSRDDFETQWGLGNVDYDYVPDSITLQPAYLESHLRNPTIVKIRNGKMFIAGNENFTRPSPFGDLQLYGRILRFDTMILEGSFPACTDATFPNGCRANWVYGHRGFNKLPITPFGGSYMDTNYALANVAGLEILIDESIPTSPVYRMFATDSQENIVSLWDNFMDNTILGSAANTRIINPLGVWDADNNRAQPNLGGLSSITFRQNLGGLVIHDAGSHYYYLIKIFQTP